MLRIEFNEARCHELYKELGLKRPVQIRVYNRVRRDRETGMLRYMGQRLSDTSWTPDIHQVIVEAGNHEQLSGLELKKQTVMTFVHELVHCQQHEHWTPEQWAAELTIDYLKKPSEIEAEGYAKLHWREWTDTLRIHRHNTNSRFGKLSQAAEKARQ